MSGRRTCLLSTMLAALMLSACGGGRVRLLSPLEVTISADPASGRAPLAVDFEVVVIGEAGYDGFAYRWSFGDGETSLEESPAHVFEDDGTFTVGLLITRIEDDRSVEETLLLEVGPNSAPSLSAAASPDAGLAPLAVQFEAFASGGDGSLVYLWDFDDGAASSLPRPLHVYAAAGAYDATVTVTDVDGDSASETVPIAVGSDEQPTPTASATPATGPAPLTVLFACTAVGGNAPVSFRWDFGDGDAVTVATATHEYAAAGTYSATCIVTDLDGSQGADSVGITVGTDSIPIAVASASPAVGDEPLTVDFTGVGIGGNGTLTYDWSFGDGNTSGSQSPTHVYAAAGVYDAILTVTDVDGDFGVDSVVITVNTVAPVDLPPNVVANVVAGQCAVPGLTLVELDASGSTDPEGGALTYNWTFVSVPPASLAALSDPTATNPTFVPDEVGTYALRAFVSDGVNVVASGLLTVTASEAAIINITGVAMQSAAAGAPFPMPLEVDVLNSCGITVPGRALEWSGTNASPASAMTVTDAAGAATNTATAGTVAGPATVSVVASGTPAVAVFDLDVLPGPASVLRMDPPTATVLPGPMPLSFSVRDAYGNLVTTTDVTFDVCVAAGFATLGAPGGPTCAALTTASGTAGVDAYDPIPETAFFVMLNLTPALAAWAEYNVFFDDLEGGDDGLWALSTLGAPVEPWELGAPSSVGPAAAVSGSNTWGTDLDAPYAFAQIFGATTATHLQRFVDFTAIVPPFSPAPLSVVLTEWEWLDVHRDEAGCPPPGGLVSLSACGVGGCPTPPDRGFDATYCTWSDGNTGSSGGWIPVAYDLTPWVPGGFVDIAWSLVRGSGSTTGAGWYLDDISVDITLAWVPGTFGP